MRAALLSGLKRGLPRTSCLVIGPMDRLQRSPRKGLFSPGVIRLVSGKQRQSALAAGCAFWDAQTAMGGPRSMKRWLDQGLALKDMIHLTPEGSEAFAKLLDDALEQQLRKHLAR